MQLRLRRAIPAEVREGIIRGFVKRANDIHGLNTVK
jgi:hypothetical protein